MNDKIIKADFKKIVNKNIIKFSDLFDRPIAFHRPFVRVTKSIKAGLFLSQCVYWSKRTKDEEGWFWKTQEEWFDEIGLTRRELENCRLILKNLDILEEKKIGAPAKIFYRINQEVLWKLLKDFSSMEYDCEFNGPIVQEKNEESSQFVQNRQTSLYKTAKLVPRENVPPLASPLSKITNNSARPRTEDAKKTEISESVDLKENGHLGFSNDPNGLSAIDLKPIGFKVTSVEYDPGVIAPYQDLGGLKSKNNETMEWVEGELERITGIKFDLTKK